MAPILHKSAVPRVLATLLLLLVGQFGAQWHSYAHGEAGAHEVQRAPALISHGACSDCLSFSPLLSATSAPAALPSRILPLMADAPVALTASLPGHGITLAFRSRAPPL